jgi:hypothetical protein
MSGRRFEPVTPDRVEDLARLFQTDGEPRRCWCMWWRLSGAEIRKTTRDGREAAFRARIADGPAPGLLAYEGGEPVGWVQVTPRAAPPRFNRSHIARSSDREAEGT